MPEICKNTPISVVDGEFRVSINCPFVEQYPHGVVFCHHPSNGEWDNAPFCDAFYRRSTEVVSKTYTHEVVVSDTKKLICIEGQKFYFQIFDDGQIVREKKLSEREVPVCLYLMENVGVEETSLQIADACKVTLLVASSILNNLALKDVVKKRFISSDFSSRKRLVYFISID